MENYKFVNSRVYTVGQISIFSGHLYRCVKIESGYKTYWNHSDECKQCKLDFLNQLQGK